jgi:hypothetical protein
MEAVHEAMEDRGNNHLHADEENDAGEEPWIVGMKRRRGLRGNVVAYTLPDTYQRAHRLTTGRIPGGRPPWTL